MPKVDGKGKESMPEKTPQQSVEGTASESASSGSGPAELIGPNAPKK
jgi:hypothetical protein